MWKNQVFVIGIIVSLSAIIFAEPPLAGRWIEDDSARTGLYNLLWARGVNWFERQYAAKLSSWKYEQTIVKEGNSFKVSGLSK